MACASCSKSSRPRLLSEEEIVARKRSQLPALRRICLRTRRDADVLVEPRSVRPVRRRATQRRPVTGTWQLRLLWEVGAVLELTVRPHGVALIAHADDASSGRRDADADVPGAADAACADAKHARHGITGKAVMTFVPSSTSRTCDAAGLPKAAPASPPTKLMLRPMSTV